jgi:mannose-1-phosphate guanylyltransferase
MNYVAIMAGGVGSRFWPASREARPKQFMDILGVGKSLLRLTYERFLQLVPAGHIYVVTHEMYRELVHEHIPELGRHQVICEPSRNNTGPCVAYTAFRLHALDPDANFVTAPSDHVILKEAAFTEHLQRALAFTAGQEAIVTLGIQPTRPDTGYGYIQYDAQAEGGVHPVQRFLEKPDLATAEGFLRSGGYLWNAGIFVWRAAAILASFRELAPDIYRILSEGEGLYNTAGETAFIRRRYPDTPSISVDYAILEKSRAVYTIPADIGWSDLGTWASLHSEREQDESGNVMQGDGVLSYDVSNSLIRMPAGKLAVIKGLEDYIVVDEGDVLLIWPKSEEQGIKKVTQVVKEKMGDKYL